MLGWLENSQLSVWIRDELWGWPLVLTLHALGTALVVGFALIIGLRLFGLFKMVPYPMLDRLFPAVWAGLGLQFLSGFILWMAKPAQYVSDSAFVLKFGLIVVGVVLTYYFQAAIKRETVSGNTIAAVSQVSVRLGAATLLVWCGVLVAGRLIAHLGSL